MNYFEIYQLKSMFHEDLFSSSSSLKKRGKAMSEKNYDMMYHRELRSSDLNPENLFTEFNIKRPDDFFGHSLSVGDIILYHQEGEEKAVYVDPYGFTEYPEFFEKKCPICNRAYTGHSAISRTDEKKICPECGLIEALEAFYDASHH